MENRRKLMEVYEINTSTLAILPVSYGNRIFSKIYELEDELISPFKPIDIIKESCCSFGSTYKGRKEATRKLIGITQKVPIAISPFIYFFPTASPEVPDCIWVAHEHVVDYRKGSEKNITNVRFSNNQRISLPISPSSFENQLMRTMMLKTRLEKKTTIYSNPVRRQLSAEESGSYFRKIT